MDKKRKNYNTTLQIDLMKKLKILAIEEDSRANDLLEEAIRDLLKKYRKKVVNKIPKLPWEMLLSTIACHRWDWFLLGFPETDDVE